MTIDFNPDISDAMRETILTELRGIETSNDVRILFAIESLSLIHI